MSSSRGRFVVVQRGRSCAAFRLPLEVLLRGSQILILMVVATLQKPERLRRSDPVAGKLTCNE